MQVIASPPRPSTWAGNRVGDAMRAGAWVFDYALPLALIWAYQRIPFRSALFGGPSASAVIASQIRIDGGGAWSLIRISASNHPDRPTLP